MTVNLDTGKSTTVKNTGILPDGFCTDPVVYKSLIYCFTQNNVLVSIEPTSGKATQVSSVPLAHNVGPWYASPYRASAASPQLLYVTNTTNGGSQGTQTPTAAGAAAAGNRPATAVDAASGATRTVRVHPFVRARHSALRRQAFGSEFAWEHERGGAAAPADDDGFTNSHSSLVALDMETGKFAEGPPRHGADGKAPATWMNALDSV
jgi:hypothetical protein